MQNTRRHKTVGYRISKYSRTFLKTRYEQKSSGRNYLKLQAPSSPHGTISNCSSGFNVITVQSLA